MTSLNLTNIVRTCLALACVWVGLVFSSPPRWVFAQDALRESLNSRALVGKAQGQWDITADQLTYDEEKKVYLAQGHVRIKSTDRSIEADWAELDSLNHLAELRGNVWLVYGRNWIQGEHVFWNLEAQTGWVDGGVAYFAQSHFYVQGARIAKTGNTQYELKDGFVTSCDPFDSDWKIRFSKLDVDLDGIAWARDVTFRVHDIPLLYTPILALPVERNRQSGFLIPWAGNSSLNGIEMEIPYFWAIRQDMDATFYARYMENRGEMVGMEYRIANKTFGDGIWLINFLHDEADKAFLSSKGYPYEAQDRYWLRSRQNFELPYGITGRLDIDMASDRNFLSEFSKGSSSYEHSNRVFRDLSGRGILNDKGILARESTLYLEQKQESSLLSLDARYWDQLDTALEDTTLQRLPTLSYSIIPSWIGDSPLYYTLRSSAVNFWANEGPQGTRLDINPHLYYPLHWNNVDIEPSAGFRATSYAVDWDRDSHDAFQGRFLSEARLDMSTRLNRVYPVDFGDNVAVQHAIRPQFMYEYVPNPAESTLPHFDRLDFNQARHDVRYGFSSFLTSKQVHADVEGNQTTNYLEFARIEVSQAFNIEGVSREVSDWGLRTPAGEGFSDLTMKVDLTPQRFVTLSYETDLSPVDGSAALQDVFLTLRDNRGDTFRLDYEYRKDSVIDEVIAQFNVQILPNIILNSYHDYSLDQQTLFSQGYGIRYQKGCWSIGLVYEKGDRDERIALTVNLLGLGNFGGGYGLGVPGTVTRIQ